MLLTTTACGRLGAALISKMYPARHAPTPSAQPRPGSGTSPTHGRGHRCVNIGKGMGR